MRKEWIGKWSDDSAEIKKNKELIEKAYVKLHGADKMNKSNESNKLWNILLTNLTLEHNDKNNKQKNKIISAEYYTRNKTMMGCLFYLRCF